MRRIVVVGCPGNGKSTLAKRLADGLGLTHIELDGLFHVTDWGSATEAEFREGLIAATDAAPDGWVTCGNYLTMSGGLHVEQADTVVWLDLPRRTVTWRTLKRTVRRAVSREALFGNDLREPLSNFTRWDPAKNIIRWAWVEHPRYRQKFTERIPSWSRLDVRHLTRQSEIDEFLEQALADHRQRSA